MIPIPTSFLYLHPPHKTHQHTVNPPTPSYTTRPMKCLGTGPIVETLSLCHARYSPFSEQICPL